VAVGFSAGLPGRTGVTGEPGAVGGVDSLLPFPAGAAGWFCPGFSPGVPGFGGSEGDCARAAAAKTAESIVAASCDLIFMTGASPLDGMAVAT
jgi:hypothetical protein